MEEFRELDSYYLVSNKGRIKSKRSNKILRTHFDSKRKGYEYITLNYDGVKKAYQVHRLVANLFLPNPNNYPCINHKDENPSNNCVENLEWCTYSYNLSYGNKTQRELNTKRENSTINAPKKVIQKSREGIFIREFPSANDAAKTLNLGVSHIIDCCNGKIHKDSKGYLYKTKTVGGFKFSWGN